MISKIKFLKIIKIFSINFSIVYLLLIPVGAFLNYSSKGIFFIKREKVKYRCLETSLDPVFTSKINECDIPQNLIGLTKEFPPNTKRDNRLDILILGGSVAVHLTDKANIEKILNMSLSLYPELNNKYKSIRVFNSALPGIKQPSGLFNYQALSMLGYKFDAVIELSGVNEIGLSLQANYKNGINLIYPRQASFQFWDNAQSLTRFKLFDLVDSFLWIHPLHQYLVSVPRFYRAIRLYLFQRKERKNSTVRLGMNFMLPNSEKEAYMQALTIWKESVFNLYTITKEKSVPYFLFIQPSQYLEDSKLFSNEEKIKFIASDENEPLIYRIAKKTSFSNELGRILATYYKRISKNDFLIPEENILDLRYLFKDIEFTLYADNCCHINDEGMILISEEISKKILSYLSQKIK